MHIRPAQSHDAPAIERIVEQAYGVYVDRIGRRPAPMDDDYAAKVSAGEVLVADANGVVGLIVLISGQDHLLVDNVAVDPLRQGEGIGRTLLAHAERHARERGLEELRLYTNAAMTENLAFYPRLGYREQGRRWEHGFDRVHFAKSVSCSGSQGDRAL